MATLEITLTQMLAQAAAERSDHPALVDLPSGRRLTYGQLHQEASVMARGLMALGLQPGDRLALWCPNRPEWIIAWLAAASAGLVLTSVDLAHSGQQLLYVLGQSGAKALVLAPGVRGDEFVTTLREICPEVDAPGPLDCPPLPELKTVIVIAETAPAGAMTWAGLREQGLATAPAELAARQAVQSPHDAATLLYTSGTTGAPKGVLSSHFGIINTSAAGAAHQKLTPEDRLCLSVPLCHMFGCVCVALTGLLAGATLVIPSPTPDPAATLAAVATEGCTAIYGPPTSFTAMMGLPQYQALPRHTLRTGVMAGAQCPIELMRQVVEEMGVRHILVGYGQTEASSWIAQTRPEDPLELRVSTVGRAIPGVEVKIIAPADGQALPVGEIGEICARGFNMKGYHNNPAATAAALDPQGWLHTGDLGSMDDQGYIRISGRLKEVIRKGGRIIFPAAIEEVLYTHPAIHTAQVFGVDHDELGEEVAAWLKLRPGCSLTQLEVAEFLRGKVPDSHLPTHVRFVDAFPMTPVGKIQKFRMREAHQGDKT